MIIQLESGQKIEVQDGSNPQQIDEVINHYSSQIQQPQIQQTQEQPQQKQSQQPPPQKINLLESITPNTTTIPASSAAFNVGIESRGRGIAQLGLDIAQSLGADVTAQKEKIAQKETQAQEQLAKQYPESGIAKTVGKFIGSQAPMALAAPLLPAGIITSGAVGGAIESATAPTESAQAGLPRRTFETATGAALGAVTGLAVKGVSNAIDAVVSGYKGLPPTIGEKLKKKASDLFKKADEQGGVLPSEVTDTFISKVKDNLVKEFKGDQKIMDLPNNKKYFDVINQFDTFKGEPLSFDRMTALDQYIGKSAADNYVTEPNISRMLNNIKYELRKTVAETPPPAGTGFNTFKEAQKVWSQSMKVADMQRIQDAAALSDQPSTAIRSMLKTFLKNKKATYGYSKQELSVIKDAAKQGIITDVLRTMGSRLVGMSAVGADGGVGAAVRLGGSILAREASGAIKAYQLTDVMKSLAGETIKKSPASNLSGLLGAATSRKLKQ